MDISIREFVTAVDGQLEMSSLPPIGGVHDTIDSIRFDSRECGRGTLFWPLAPADGRTEAGTMECSDEAFADHAFANGALGVVVSRRTIEPWAGGFAVRVDDCQGALERFARWNRRRFLAPLALVLDFDDTVGKYLEALWRGPGGLGGGVCVRTAEQNEIGLAQLEEEGAYHIVVVPSDVLFSNEDAISRISDLCQPDIAVITPLAFETHRNAHQNTYRNCPQRLLEKLLPFVKEAPVAIVPGDNSTANPCWDFSGEILRYGLDESCQIRAEGVHDEGATVTFHVRQRGYRIRSTSDRSLSQSLATVALCDLLKIDRERIQSALLTGQESRVAS